MPCTGTGKDFVVTKNVTTTTLFWYNFSIIHGFTKHKGNTKGKLDQLIFTTNQSIFFKANLIFFF